MEEKPVYNKEEAIEWFRKYACWDKNETSRIIRELDRLGYFTAPASTKYHGNYEGGLFEHSRNVYTELMKLTRNSFYGWHSVFIVAMLHDLCKADQYVKLSDGTGYGYNNDTVLKGHGDKSVMMCGMLGIKLSEEEAACIMYHMGAFTEKEKWNDYTGAIHKYPLVLYTHMADMIASHIIEV